MELVIDLGMELRMESGIDSGMESRMESVIDSGMELGMELVIDSGMESGIELKMELGIESGMASGMESGLSPETEEAGVEPHPYWQEEQSQGGGHGTQDCRYCLDMREQVKNEEQEQER